MLKGPQIVLAHLVAVHPESAKIVFPEKAPSGFHDNFALALVHRAQPLAAILVRLSDDTVINLSLAEP